MGVPPGDGKNGALNISRVQSDTEIKGMSWNNSFVVPTSGSATPIQDAIANGDWKVSLSPYGAFLKTHRNGEVQSIETTDAAQRDTFIQKMHQSQQQPRRTVGSKMLPLTWAQGHCGKECSVIDKCWYAEGNVSNNYNGYDDSSSKACSSRPSRDRSSGRHSSDYTEYPMTYRYGREAKKEPVKEKETFGFKDFSKYDRMPVEEMNAEEGCSLGPMTYLTDYLFFGDKPKRQRKPAVVRAVDQGVYFSPKIMTGGQEHMDTTLTFGGGFGRDEDSHRFNEPSRYSGAPNNHNNNSDHDDSYTGLFRNEEEYKPTYEGLFNNKPNMFSFQKRTPDGGPNYFHDRHKNLYYDEEDSTTYAFEKKPEPVQNKVKKPHALYKIGGIVVRDNVECEIDYAQNINMDLAEEPMRWARYDDTGDDSDASSYARNVSHEEFGGSKPWNMDDTRKPWREFRSSAVQNCKGEAGTPVDKAVNKANKGGSTSIFNKIKIW